ncbi:MAG: cyclase family protein [Planctomycetota bacterium]|jgi:kynurenine formamidase|nr:cyclase family protein [Planctomycetota bacterium]
MEALSQFAELMAKARLVELSHHLEEGIPIWPTHSRFFKMVWHSPEKGDDSLNYQFVMNEHNGTHVDSLAHFFPKGGVSIDKMPPETFSGPCAVINVESVGKGGTAEPGHILDWEKENGRIAKGDVVVLNYGWHRLWKLMPDHLPFITDFPGLSEKGAELLRDRGAKLVGCDPMAVDALKNSGQPAHHVLLGSGVAIVENLANLDQLPPRCYFLCLPLRIRGGSGSPVRPVALVL